MINQPVTFNASSSASPVGTTNDQLLGIYSYTWDFGDGSPVVTTTNPVITHAFSSVSTPIVQLTVTNLVGTSTSSSSYFNGQLMVRNGQPIPSGEPSQYQSKIKVVSSGNTSTTTIASSLNPSSFDDQIVFSATVTGSTTTIPTGVVKFYDNGILLEKVRLNGSGLASFETSSLTGGTHTISAIFSGDEIYTKSSGTLYQEINPISTTITITSHTPNPSIYGQTVNFTAHVETTTGTLNGTVNFFDITFVNQPILFGTAELDPETGNATISTSELSRGLRFISATYVPSPIYDSNHTGSFAPTITQTVNLETTTLLTSSSPVSILGQLVTFTATVTPNPSIGNPTGTVTFYADGVVIGTGTLSTVDGVTTATFSTSNLSLGAHEILAVYGGDSLTKVRIQIL